MIPRDDPAVTGPIGDARLTLLAIEGDLLRLMELHHDEPLESFLGAKVQIAEARAAIQRSGQALGAEALAEVSLEHILDEDYVLCADLKSARTDELITEVGTLQGICTLLIGDDEEDCEDDGIPSFRALVAAKLLRDRRIFMIWTVLIFVYMAWLVVGFPSRVEGHVRAEVEAACLMDEACLSAVEGAIPSCTAERLNWSPLLWELLYLWGQKQSDGWTQRSWDMKSVRDWRGLVDCLNEAAGEPVLFFEGGDHFIVSQRRKRILDALKAP